MSNLVTGRMTRALSRTTSTPPTKMLDNINRIGAKCRLNGTIITSVNEDEENTGDDAEGTSGEIIKANDIRHYFGKEDPSQNETTNQSE